MTFQVTASSQTSVNYQWFKNGSSILGATLSSYTLGNVSTNDQGAYSVVVSNLVGYVISSNAILTVLTQPVITNQPPSQTVGVGGTVSFSVAGIGLLPISYQWSFNGVNLVDSPDVDGSTNATLTLYNVQTNDAGGYTVVVANSLGSVTSAVATLTVAVPPTITNSPLSQGVIQGQTAVFSVGAAGTAPFLYQWKMNGTNVFGATNASLTLTNVQPSKAGTYTVLIANVAGSATSDPATLVVYVRPAITTQPLSQTVVQGTNISLSVVASGTVPFSYQWTFNGANLDSGTNSTLALNNVQAGSAGSYRVVITNMGGAITSSVATLTVKVPAFISTQPQSLAITLGQTAVFSAVAGGTTPVSSQWYFNGASVGGATNGTLTLANVQTNKAGNYIMVVSNAWGKATSAVAVLTVNVPASISQQPVSKTVIQGQNALFSVTAGGTAPWSYQWNFNGTNLDGATNSTLALTGVQSNNAGSYKVMVANVAGSVTSTVATLTVYVPPMITTQPQSLALLQGQTAAFSFVAGGSSPFTNQWYFNGSSLGSSGQSSTLTLTNVNATKVGNYTVVVSNPGGSATSTVAVLTVYGIQTQPQSLTVIQGQDAWFSVVPSGPAPLGYQWFFNGSAVSGASDALLTLFSAQTNQAGSYFVVIATPVGSITSQVATLTVNVPAFITSQPQSLTVTQGQTAAFSIAAAGTPSLSYQWYFNGTTVLGATNTTLTLTNAQVAKAGNYVAVVNNSWGWATSAVAVLTVYVPPSISPQPVSQAVIQGQNALFSVGASGTLPLSYQWSFNGANLDSETNATLALTSVQPNNAGGYTVVVTNVAGSVTSTVATLTVYVPPTIMSQPQSVTLLQGQTAALSFLAGGSSPFTNQWYFNGSSLGSSGQSSTLTLTNVNASKAGNYTVVVSNPGGSATSTVAVLTVYGIQTQPQSLTVIQGQDAWFSVVPSGPAALGYQWFFNGSAVSGASDALLTLFSAQTNQAGSYFVVIATPVGSITSQVATLTVNVPAFITSQPQSLTVTQGQTAAFSIAAAGTPSLSYQWYFNGTTVLGATNTTLTLTNAQVAKAGNYVAVVNNSWGWATSAVAVLTVYVPPSISPQPVSQAVIQGQNALFSVGASGTLPLSYQWSFNGANLDSETNATLALTSVQADDAGGYTVVVTNVAGSVTSTVATLTVYVPPTIMSQPQSVTLLQGQTAAFSVVASGSSPFTYQWYFNGSASGSASSNPTNTINSVSSLIAGNYTVVVTNPGGSATSAVAVLTVYGIQTQPQSLAVVQGQNASFSVVPSGPAPLGYQWFFNGSALSGGTNVSLTLTNAQTNQVGGYSVVIATPVGSITSQVATLTVNVPAFIANQPQSLIVTQGQTAKFTIAGGGTPSLSYQWYFNGARMGGGGAKGTTLTISAAAPSDAGNYTAVVNNSWGSATSAVAVLTVYVPPSISPQPVSQAVIQGQNALFSVGASGTFPLSYQWRFNGTNLGNATNSALALTSVQTNNAGGYTVVVTNVAGSVTSTVATLTVYVPPMITTQPQSLALLQGQTAAFSFVAGGSSPFTNQWYFNGSSLGSSGQSSTLTLTNVNATKAGNYTVVVSNPGGSATSAVAVLAVYGIQTQPQNLAVVQGQNASFSVVPSGPAPLGYQWFFNGSPLSGGTNVSLTLTNAQTNQVGSYFVVIATPVGSITSQVATLTVNVPAFITSQPQSLTVTQGQTAAFSIAAAGTPSLSCQWYFNGTTVLGATNTTLTLTNAQVAKAGNYVAVANNSWGWTTSAVAILTVYVPPSISPQPLSQAVIQGQNALFSVGAAGTLPLSYQWRFNGTNLDNGTNSALALTSVQTNNGGGYTVVVTNVAGSVTSAVATLTVYVPPTITSQPQSLTLLQGQTAAFSVVASGSSPFSYQWYLNGSASGSASSNPTNTINNVSATTADNYTVVVTNPGGSITSAVAVLTVYGIQTQPQSLTVVQGQNASFSVVPSGPAPLGYQWFFNGSALSGGTNVSLTLNNAQTNQVGGYFVVIATPVGSITSQVATLTVNVPAFIASQPQSLIVTQSQTATFTVAGGGTPSLSYQWYFNGVKMGSGSTSPTLSLAGVATNNAGNYMVAVNNAYGSVTSVVVSLTVLVPASILTQPASLAVTLGQNAAFSVVAAGDAPLSYQWTFSGTNVAGATNAALFLTNVQTNQAGNYAVLVANNSGSVTSSIATLTVYLPTVVTNQPQSLAVVQGQTASFSVGASGSAPFAYQWYFNGVAVSTGATRTMSNVVSSAAGNYWVVVAGLGGSVTSTVATLTVYVPPSIGSQPSSAAAVQGQTALFSVLASGSPAPNYQWYLNGANLVDGPRISGSASNTLTLAQVQAAQAGSVFVVVTNIAGSITSTVKSLTVYVPPAITNQPQAQSLVAGQTATFSVGALGTPTLTYQWYFNGASLGTSGNTASLTLSSVQTNKVGSYWVVVNNTYGSATSVVASLTLIAKPGITTQPQNQTVALGQTASFSIVATSSVPMSYQWYCNGSLLAGATNSTLAVTGVHTNDAGGYMALVGNSAGFILSSNASLTVTNPSINLSVASGQGMTSSGFTMQFSVPIGSTYVIQASTNLTDWTSIATNGAVSGTVVFTDTSATNYTRRLYRVMLP